MKTAATTTKKTTNKLENLASKHKASKPKKTKKEKVVYLKEGATYRDLQKAGKQTREDIRKNYRSLSQCIKAVQEFQGEWATMLNVQAEDYDYKAIMNGMTEKQLAKFKETSMTSEFVVMEAIRRNKKEQASK